MGTARALDEAREKQKISTPSGRLIAIEADMSLGFSILNDDEGPDTI